MKFNKVLFWCEFPKEVNWKRFNKILNFNIEVYIAAKNKKEFNFYKSKIKTKKVKKIGVWPTLSKKEGYWFSGYSSKKSINKLKQFKKLKIKIDLEPPLLDINYNFFKLVGVYIKLLISKRPKNKNYLNKTILELNKN